MATPQKVTGTPGIRVDSTRAVLLSLLFIPLPVLHPLLIPLLGPPSHLLWWVYVAPVALLSYTFGVRGAAWAVPGSIVLMAGLDVRSGGDPDRVISHVAKR